MSGRDDGPATMLPETEWGTAPVSPSPASASAGAQAPGPSVSSSVWDINTTVAAVLQDPQALSDTVVEKIHREMSHARMSRYAAIAGGDRRLALALHAWNAAVAGSLLPGIQIAEVTIRNIAVNRVISRYKKAWFTDQDFLRKLGSGKNKEDLNLSTSAIKEKVNNASEISNYLTRDLNFGFWVNLFSKKFHDDLWKRDLWTYLPNVGHGKTIRDLHGEVDAVREFRNDIAHHKNIVTKQSPRTPLERFNAVMGTLAELSPAAERYAREICLFPTVWAACPMPENDFCAGVEQLRGGVK